MFVELSVAVELSAGTTEQSAESVKKSGSDLEFFIYLLDQVGRLLTNSFKSCVATCLRRTW